MASSSSSTPLRPAFKTSTSPCAGSAIRGAGRWTTGSRSCRSRIPGLGVLERLLERGLVGARRLRLLGLPTATTCPAADGRAKAKLRERLQEAVSQGPAADPRDRVPSPARRRRRTRDGVVKLRQQGDPRAGGRPAALPDRRGQRKVLSTHGTLPRRTRSVRGRSHRDDGVLRLAGPLGRSGRGPAVAGLAGFRRHARRSRRSASRVPGQTQPPLTAWASDVAETAGSSAGARRQPARAPRWIFALQWGLS